MLNDVMDSRQHGNGFIQGENEVLKLIVEREPLATVLNSIVLLAERFGSPGLICSILLFDKSGLRPAIGSAPNLPAAYNRAVDGVMIGPDVGLAAPPPIGEKA
jgi:hypothetical protein